jgi:hypothetical protein
VNFDPKPTFALDSSAEEAAAGRATASCLHGSQFAALFPRLRDALP